MKTRQKKYYDMCKYENGLGDLINENQDYLENDG